MYPTVKQQKQYLHNRQQTNNKFLAKSHMDKLQILPVDKEETHKTDTETDAVTSSPL
jgi:hypothetical protein